jgi:hypothetical protein
VKLGWLALMIAVAGAVCVALPGAGMFGAIGLGIFASVAGFVGYRRRDDPGPARLGGAGALALGIIVFGLGTTRYVLTLVAIDRIERWLGA